jgi:20S proteasome subunit alpha 7
VEKLIHSRLLVPSANHRLYSGDYHIGIATTGLLADSRHVLNRVKEEANSYRDIYRAPIPGRVIAERLGQYFQAYTLYSSVRPFGTSVLLASMDENNGPQLFMIEPSGAQFGYFGCAIGKGKQVAKTEIEKLNLANMTSRDAVKEVARIIYSAHDEIKDKDLELEISWICNESLMKHLPVPKDLLDEAKEFAKVFMFFSYSRVQCKHNIKFYCINIVVYVFVFLLLACYLLFSM